MKKYIYILFCIVIFIAIANCDSNSTNENKTTVDSNNTNISKDETTVDSNGTSIGEDKVTSENRSNKMADDFVNMSVSELKEHHALIKTQFGEIELEFYPDTAPGHVKNFLKLASTGFYDDTTFHRVIRGFMIQGGDPNTKDDDPTNDGYGGPGYSIKAEFSDISHKRGILSMARSQDPDSAGSQFFIMQATQTQLDGQYSVFGNVVKGLEIVDKIVSVKADANDRPIEDVKMKVEIFKVK